MDKYKSKYQDKCTSIAGKYVYYDEGAGEFRLGKGTIRFQEGMITSIDEFVSDDEDVIVLDDGQLIFPGLMNLHDHTETNVMQIFGDSVVGDVYWDNRFEWRCAEEYFAKYQKPNSILTERWNDVFGGIDSDLTVGDMVALYSELQAVAGGTAVIQEDGNAGIRAYLDNHRRIRLMRSTSCAEDIRRDDNLPMASIVRLYRPDAELDADDASTYLPHQNTGWNTVETIIYGSDGTYIDMIIDNIKARNERNTGGFLIHLAEGRAGNIYNEKGREDLGQDIYSRTEFETFKNRIMNEIESGGITYEDVRNAHITLIHACGLNLDDEESYSFIRDCGIALSWSPVSNLLLYKDTPDFYNYLDDEDIMVTIGADWCLSGSKTIWDECKFALEFIKKQNDMRRDEIPGLKKNLLKAVTVTGARTLGSNKLGNIAEGKCADLMIIDAGGAEVNDIDAAADVFFSVDERSVSMVYVDGEPVYGDREYIDDHIGDGDLVWANIESTVPELEKKYYNITGIGDKDTFYKLLKAFTEMAESLGCDISLLRSTEDQVYRKAIKELADRFGMSTEWCIGR